MEESWMDTQKGDVQVKERKEARHEGSGVLVSCVFSQWAFDQPTCKSEGASISFLLPLLHTDVLREPPCLGWMATLAC